MRKALLLTLFCLPGCGWSRVCVDARAEAVVCRVVPVSAAMKVQLEK